MTQNIITATVADFTNCENGLMLQLVVDEEYSTYAEKILVGSKVPVVVARLTNQSNDKWVAQEQDNHRIANQKLRDSAKGQECQIRIGGVCNNNPETTVLAHVGNDSGMAMKASDIEAAFACSDCHAVIDGHVNHDFDADFLKLRKYEAAERTRAIWVEMDLIRVKK